MRFEDVFSDIDDAAAEKLSAEYPVLDDRKKARLYAMSKRKFDNTNDNEGRRVEVSGVDKYRRPKWYRSVSIAAAAVLVVAGIGGSTFLISRNGKSPASDASKQTTAAVTESAADTSAADNSALPTKDEIIELMSSSNEYYEKVCVDYHTKETNNEEGVKVTSTEKVQYNKKSGTVYKSQIINKNGKSTEIISLKRNGMTGIYCPSTKEYWRGKEAGYSEQVNNLTLPEFYLPAIPFANDTSVFIAYYVPMNKECWEVTGKDKYLGRECAVIKYDAADIMTLYVDLKTGLCLKADYANTLGTAESSFEVDSIRFDDETDGDDFFTVNDFKELIKDRVNTDEDISFLDDVSTSEITQESLYKLMLDPLSNFDKCYIVYSTWNGQPSTKIAVSQSEGIYSSEISHVWDYSYNGKRISIPKNPDDKVIVENPLENLKKRLFDKEVITNCYGDFSKWKISGTDTYLGRECALIEASYEEERYFDPEEFKKTNGEHGRENVVYLIHVDLQTGIVLRVEVPEMGEDMLLTNVTEVYFDDEAASHITTPAEVREYIENGDYELEEGLTLDFLGGKTSETTTEATTADITTTATETTTKAPRTTIENGEPATIPDIHIFEALDELPYHAISCDGIPTHKLTAPDGTVYYLNLDEDASYKYVWRRPSLIGDPDNEAPLTDEVVAAIRENWDSLDIVKYTY